MDDPALRAAKRHNELGDVDSWPVLLAPPLPPSHVAVQSHMETVFTLPYDQDGDVLDGTYRLWHPCPRDHAAFTPPGPRYAFDISTIAIFRRLTTLQVSRAAAGGRVVLTMV